MYSPTDLATDLEKILLDLDGYDVSLVSKAAFEIYQNRGLELNEAMDRALLTLMAMDEGDEFELTKDDFLSLISEIRML